VIIIFASLWRATRYKTKKLAWSELSPALAWIIMERITPKKMERDLTQEKIETALGALRDLASQPLPVGTRSALSEATQSLQALKDELLARQEQNRLGALYGVSQTLGTSLDVNEVLQQVMEAVIRLTGAERGFIMLLNPESREWQWRAVRNFDQDQLSPKDMEISRTVIQTVLHSQQGLVTTDAQTDPRFSNQESVTLYALRSILCAPLRARGSVIGVIYVDNRAIRARFTEDDLQLLTAFAGQAAIAIENARLYTRTDLALTQRVTELETLTQIDQALNASLDIDRVLEITRHWAIEGTQSQDGIVWLLPEAGNEFDPGSLPLVSSPQGYLPPASSPLPEGLDSRHLGSLLETAFAKLEPKSLPLTQEHPAVLVVPARHAEQSLGGILVWRQRSFERQETQFLLRLASRAAPVVVNARLYQAVQQANLAKSKFISIVSHELRTPMTSIKGYTDLMRQGAVGALNSQQLGFLDIVRSNIERMAALVADLSDVSRIETGRLKLEFEWVAIPEYVEEALRNLRPRLDQKHQTLKVALSPGLPKVYADPNRLVQVLNNLINNACKYTPEGGKIGITAAPQENSVRLEVSDNGIGISTQDQAHLFTQFFRSEDPVVREEQGWGLGLDVTRRLVGMMGGQIGFRSELGEGSVFWFTLPVSENAHGMHIAPSS
jgi:signal transduction histidine kinase